MDRIALIENRLLEVAVLKGDSGLAFSVSLIRMTLSPRFDSRKLKPETAE
jgi:hypothetical protein